MANSSTKDALHSVTKHNDISISGVSSNEVLRFDGTNWVNSLPSSSLVVTQSSHGFSVGDVLKSSGSNGAYAKAQANNAGNAEVLGIVTAVADTNTFTLTVSGYITTAAAVPNVTAGSALFLSASTAGALTATEPSTAGQISKPVAIVTTANAAMIIVAYRGETISTGANNWDVNGSELVLDADGDTSLTADTDDQIDVKISGADDFRFTANKLDVLSGSTLEINGTLDINGTELILDANGNTSITADTDDQIDIKISGADDFRFTANNFNILSGSTLTIDSGATIANSGTATGFSSGPSQAIQSAIEAETNQDTYVPPDLLKHHPGVAKARWNGNANVSPMQQHEQYNISGFTDNGTGDHTFEFDTDFSTVNYSFFAMVGHIGGEFAGGISVTQYDSDAVARAVGSTRISVAYGHYTSGPLSGHNFTKVDCNELDLVFFGDQ